jgi:hypothetical protein
MTKTAFRTALFAVLATFALYAQSTAPAAAAFDAFLFFDDGK